MNDILSAALKSGMAGILGTGLGGFAALLIKGDSRRMVSFLLEFAAGLMIGISVFDLLPEAMELAPVAVILGGVCCGTAVTVAIQWIIEKAGMLRPYPQNVSVSGRVKIIGKVERTLLNCGVVTLLGISLHNFFEGIAIGSGYAVSHGLGASLLAAIALHDFPEGVALAAPLKGGGVSSAKVVFFAALSGVPTLAGGAAGMAIGGMSPEIVGFCLALAAGTMLYISFGDIIPSSKKLFFSKWQAILNIIGFLAGFLITAII